MSSDLGYTYMYSVLLGAVSLAICLIYFVRWRLKNSLAAKYADEKDRFFKKYAKFNIPSKNTVHVGFGVKSAKPYLFVFWLPWIVLALMLFASLLSEGHI